MAGEITTVLEARIGQLALALQTLVRDYAPNHLKGFVVVNGTVTATRATLSIRVENTMPVQKYGSADAAAQEFGSGPSSTKGSSWDGSIVPVNGTYLKFYWEKVGDIVYTTHVQSPGIRPYEGRGYVAPAIAEFKTTVLPSIDPDIRDAVNLAIRKSFPGATKK